MDSPAAQATGMSPLTWQALTDADLSQVTRLAERVQGHDGGSDYAVEPGFLSTWYSSHRHGIDGGAARVGVGPDGTVLAAGAVRADGQYAAVVGMVDPAARSRGIGAALLDWSLAAARDTRLPPQIHTEWSTRAAERLYQRRGLVCVFAEDVLVRPLDDLGHPEPPPAGITVEAWQDAVAPDFAAAWTASFADRPGFPGWPAQRWIDWTSADEDFCPHASLLARDGTNTPVGFVTCARNWIVQVGVRPGHRRSGLASALVGHALVRLRADGSIRAALHVNVDNPGAAALHHSLGFTAHGRRARYRRG